MSTDGQLVLPLGLRPQPLLQHFSTLGNEEAVAAVQQMLSSPGPRCLYLSGPGGSGKSHLLQGAALAAGPWSPYLDLADWARHGAAPSVQEALQSLGSAVLLCLDGVDAVAGQRPWEELLFALYNERLQSQRPLLIAGRLGPRSAPWQLADWGSRCSACLHYALHLPDDEQRLAILQQMVRQRGLFLREDAAYYLLRHWTRDLGQLEQIIEQLDNQSWARQRELSIPFIRSCLTAAGQGAHLSEEGASR